MQSSTRERVLKVITLIGIYAGLLMPAIFLKGVIFPFVFSKLIFFQVVIGLTFPAYVALAILEPKYRPSKHLLVGAVGAYFIVLALSVVFSVDPYRSWWGNQERMNGLFTLLHFFAWFTMMVGVVRRWEDWRKLLNAQIVMSVFMAMGAILQQYNPGIFGYEVGTVDVLDRVGGLLDNPIYMAAYQIFNLGFLALLAIKDKRVGMRVWYGVAAVIDLVAFFFAQSRGALLGLVAGLAMFTLVYILLSESKRVKQVAAGAFILFLAAYGALFALRDTAFVKASPFERLTNFQVTTATRLIAWKIGLQGFAERPITGWGLDTFHIVFNSHYRPESLHYSAYETWFDRAHNTVIDVLSMTGILGVITFFGMFGALFYSVWRAYKHKWIDVGFAAALSAIPVAYFVQNLFVFDHPALFCMSYFLFAFVVAATSPMFVGESAAELPETQSWGKRYPLPLWGNIALFVPFVAIVWFYSILPYRASALSIQGSLAFQRGLAQQAYSYYEQSWNTHTPYRDELGFILSRDLSTLGSQGALARLPDWKKFYDLAVEVDTWLVDTYPRNTNFQYFYARLLHDTAVTTQIPVATIEERYKIAIETSPKRQQLIYSLARLYIQVSRFDDAEALYQQLINDDSEFGDNHWLLGSLYLVNEGNEAEGSKEIIKSQTVQIPYQLQRAEELEVLVSAYLIQKDDAGLAKALENLETYPKGNAQLYAVVARRLQAAGKTAERDRVLEYGQSVDPATGREYQQPGSAAAALKQVGSSSTTPSMTK